MRIGLVLIAAVLLLIETGGIVKPAGTLSIASSAIVAADSTQKTRVEFESQIKPILKAKCMPCHFSGGKVYDRLPFDKPETIRKLGVKLFTRIKEEHDRRLIEDFLSQSP